ncbi:MAG: cytochrome c [Aquabacterium sp.]
MNTWRPRLATFAHGLLALLAIAALPGCQRAVEDMHQQPKYEPGRPAPLFPDGLSQRSLPPGTQAHAQGALADTSSGRLGRDAVRSLDESTQAQTYPHPVTAALLSRGQERYNIYCLPCHSPLGDGDGLVVRRGFPAPPSYHTDRLRQATDRHFYDVITQGYGEMYSHADRLSPQDRWAIVAFIRALQLSQHAPVQSLPATLRQQVSASPASSSRMGKDPS